MISESLVTEPIKGTHSAIAENSNDNAVPNSTKMIPVMEQNGHIALDHSYASKTPQPANSIPDPQLTSEIPDPRLTPTSDIPDPQSDNDIPRPTLDSFPPSASNITDPQPLLIPEAQSISKETKGAKKSRKPIKPSLVIKPFVNKNRVLREEQAQNATKFKEKIIVEVEPGGAKLYECRICQV